MRLIGISKILIFMLLVISCQNKSLQDQKAKEISDKVISNMDKQELEKYLTKTYFSKESISVIISDAKFCNWSSRKGGLVNIKKRISNGSQQIAFEYRFKLKKCGNIQVINVLNITKKGPILQSIHVDPI